MCEQMSVVCRKKTSLEYLYVSRKILMGAADVVWLVYTDEFYTANFTQLFISVNGP